MDALYVKTPSGLQKVEIGGTGGGGSVSRKVFTSSNRSETLTAGTALVVPAYTVGDNSLSVYIGGLLCSKGVEYNEVTAKTISFTSDMPANFEITVVAYSSSESAGGAVAVQTDESRASVLKAGGCLRRSNSSFSGEPFEGLSRRGAVGRVDRSLRDGD